MGDFFFNIPARKVSNYHRGESLFYTCIIVRLCKFNYYYNFFLLIDAGAPVYMYEFQHASSLLTKNRPNFVGCDHGDEIFFILGYCFGKDVNPQGLLLFIY